MSGSSHSRVAIIAAAATPVGRLTPKDESLPEGFEQEVLSGVTLDALGQCKLKPSDVDTAIFTSPTTRIE